MITPLTPPIPRTDVDPSNEASVSAFVTSVEAFYDTLSTDFVTEVNATEDNMELLEASAQTAKTDAETAATAAQTAQGLAEDARDLAQSYAQDASDAVAILPNGSINDTTPSLTQAYSSQKTEDRLAEERAEIEALIVPSFQLGDLMESAKGLSAPAWLACNQNLYNTTTYADLYAMLGNLPAPTTTTYTTTAQASGGGFGLGKNGNHFAYGMSSSPYIGAYYWNGSTYQSLTMTAGSTTPEFVSIGASGSDSYVLATGDSGICGFYKLNNIAQTKLTNPTGNIGNAVATAWNDNASVVVGAQRAGVPYASAYTRSGDTLTQLTVPTGATEATYQCAINSDGTVFYTIGTTKVFKYTISGTTVNYVGSYSHGLSFVPTNAPRLKAELTGDGKYLFIGQRSVTTANGIILGVFDTVNETMQYINANAATHRLEDAAGTKLATYNGFSRLGQTKMIANLVSGSYYNVVATIFDTANGLHVVEELSFWNGAQSSGANTVHACDTYCIGANSAGGTTVWKTNLGNYLPNIPKKYINTGVQS